MRDGLLVESSPFVGHGKFVGPVAICSSSLPMAGYPSAVSLAHR